MQTTDFTGSDLPSLREVLADKAISAQAKAIYATLYAECIPLTRWSDDTFELEEFAGNRENIADVAATLVKLKESGYIDFKWAISNIKINNEPEVMKSMGVYDD